MADATVSRILEQLASISKQEEQQRVKLVVGVHEVQVLRSELQAIQAVLLDAEQRQVKDRAVGVWLGKLKDTCYDLEDVLDEWRTALLKLRIEGVHKNVLVPKSKKVPFFPFSCFNYKRAHLRLQIAIKIKEISRNLYVIAREKERFNFDFIRSSEGFERIQTTSFIDVSDMYGRENEKNALVCKLLEDGEHIRNPHIISIVGMGGIGKTTLAQIVYNHDRVIKNFDARVWVCVSDPFDEYRVAKAIVESLQVSSLRVLEFESLLSMIRDAIVGRRFLLVLDDVWTENYSQWEPFYHCLKNGAYGSRILITTRKETVARMMDSRDIITVNQLPEEVCWVLFRNIAFSGRTHEECESLEEIGRHILRKCKGLPLAIKTIGSLLRIKKQREEWQIILHSELWELEEFEKVIFSPLLLSYHALPSTIKQCFSYCVIFPKGCHIDKEQLIKLWMTQGFLGLENNMEMERVGEKYFDHLATQSFFQDFEKDGDGNILFFKMHDIVHDFACFIQENELYAGRRNQMKILEVNALEDPFINFSLSNLYHSTLILGVGAPFPLSICNRMKSLRSLLIQYGATNYQSINEIIPRLFGESTRLRALDVSGNIWYENMVLDIPKEIGKLMHLRYLNLSWLKIKELPEVLCGLYNLQTLELRGCADLKSLPQGMGKLINLRHLVNEGTSLTCIPKGIERLTCLRTLSEFVLSGDDNGDKACTLESLANLKHLRGSLQIKMLGNLIEVNVAEKAELRNKDLLFLNLNFEKDAEEERMNVDREGGRMDKDEQVLDHVLQPPLSLERLEITYYRGNVFPNWIMSLTKLRMLSLHDCMNITHLPPLGGLPSLESLSLRSMKSVKRVGNEFLGIGSDNTSSSSFVPFPKLKSLKFVNMEEFEKWDCGTIMPCLRSLSFVYCPKLKALSAQIFQMETLEELNINWCPILKKRCTPGMGVDWPKISHIPNIMINFESAKRGVQRDVHKSFRQLQL